MSFFYPCIHLENENKKYRVSNEILNVMFALC